MGRIREINKLIVMGSFKILTLNFSRYKNMQKILEVWERLKQYELDCLCLQEIDVESAITCFEKDFKVIVNWDTKSNNKIGIAMLLKKSIKIEDKIIGENGRIIGIKIKKHTDLKYLSPVWIHI